MFAARRNSNRTVTARQWCLLLAWSSRRAALAAAAWLPVRKRELGTEIEQFEPKSDNQPENA